ncbi:MAG: nitroreductase family deazaflavin-dependent oxidoreductase, partial [Acidimicrobiia bacterium]
DWNTGIAEEFRANGGKVGGMFEGAPLLILHTTGAKSGAMRENPLMYLKHDDRLFVFASKAGAHSHPDWYYNAKANPNVKVEVGTSVVDRTAVELGPADRDTIYAEQVSRYPQFGKYAASTDRTIPVIELV